MSQHDNNKDNQLADFADQVLQGKMNQPASSSDLDLLRLEETILRLKQTLPTETPDAVKTKQMLTRLKARIKREEEAASAPFWKKLFNLQSNPQIGIILMVAMMLILAIVSVPSLELSASETITGTANNSSNLFIGGGVVGLLLLLYWIFRKK
ncbi:MAG: LPXTG cell wall anchor domain-containing protein [Anaerolineales bacterium]